MGTFRIVAGSCLTHASRKPEGPRKFSARTVQKKIPDPFVSLTRQENENITLGFCRPIHRVNVNLGIVASNCEVRTVWAECNCRDTIRMQELLQALA